METIGNPLLKVGYEHQLLKQQIKNTMNKPSKLFLLVLLMTATIMGCTPDPIVPDQPDEPVTPDPDTPNIVLPEGALGGLFSVSEGQQVRFSQGNLQYQASTSTWRFAENQTDCIGDGNANIGDAYDGWIDLFGWGTSGFNHGAVCYQPWSSSQDPHDYCAYGNPNDNLYSQTGQADWGYNAISNGGSQNGL